MSVTDREQVAGISFYSMKFYAMVNGEKRTIMYNSVVDQTGGSINVTGNLGRIAAPPLRAKKKEPITVPTMAYGLSALRLCVWLFDNCCM